MKYHPLGGWIFILSHKNFQVNILNKKGQASACPKMLKY